VDLERIAAWCGRLDIAVEPRGDALWIANPAAPAYGVTVRARPGQLDWSLALPRVVAAERVPEVARALAHLNPAAAAPGAGRWELDPASRTVRFSLTLPAAADDDELMAALRTVIEQGNEHVHGLVEVIDGREPADHVRG
jgi:hypothetical protein